MAFVIDCYLVPEDKTLDTINIPHGQEIVIGRPNGSEYHYNFCSRRQLTLLAQYDKAEVIVKNLGRNPASIDGRILLKDARDVLRQGSSICLVHGFLKHSLQFKFTNSSINKRMRHEAICEVSSSKQAKLNNKWKDFFDKTLLEFTTSEFIYRKKVASFDLDSTLIRTKALANDLYEWMFWDPIVKITLTELYKRGYMLVIFTNQAGLSPPEGEVKVPCFKSKIEAIAKHIDLPLKVLVATSHGLFRKPAPGMWYFLVDQASVTLDMETSFYVGDAAGRAENWKQDRKKDFAISDRLFAENLNLTFYTPDEFFFKEPKAAYLPVPLMPDEFVLSPEPNYGIPSAEPEVILMVGVPASGKTTFVNDKLIPNGYIRLTSDYDYSWQESVIELRNAITARKHVVIDNTNHDAEFRERYINVCEELKVRVRCFVMGCSMERALHNNVFRIITDKKHLVITSNTLRLVHANYAQPQMEEGFSEILYVPLIPRFKSKAQKRMYMYHLVSRF